MVSLTLFILTIGLYVAVSFIVVVYRLHFNYNLILFSTAGKKREMGILAKFSHSVELLSTEKG